MRRILSLLFLLPTALASAGAMAHCGGTVTSDATLDGTWTGYIENFHFPSGSDSVVLTLHNSGGVVTGTAVLGNSTPPPPPTDPDGPSPPPEVDGGMQNAFPGEGFVYTLVPGTFDGSRVQVSVDTAQLWNAYCALQTKTYEVGPVSGVYSCVPADWAWMSWYSTCTSTDPANPSHKVSYDCEKRNICQTCACTATGCTGTRAPAPVGDLTFDMRFTPGQLHGSTSALLDYNGPPGGPGPRNLDLTKQ